MDVFDRDLKAIETTRLGCGDFLGEAFDEVLVDDSVGGGEEGKNVGDEMLFFGFERLPVLQILRMPKTEG